MRTLLFVQILVLETSGKQDDFGGSDRKFTNEKGRKFLGRIYFKTGFDMDKMQQLVLLFLLTTAGLWYLVVADRKFSLEKAIKTELVMVLVSDLKGEPGQIVDVQKGFILPIVFLNIMDCTSYCYKRNVLQNTFMYAFFKCNPIFKLAIGSAVFLPLISICLDSSLAYPLYF